MSCLTSCTFLQSSVHHMQVSAETKVYQWWESLPVKLLWYKKKIWRQMTWCKKSYSSLNRCLAAWTGNHFSVIVSFIHSVQFLSSGNYRCWLSRWHQSFKDVIFRAICLFFFTLLEFMNPSSKKAFFKNRTQESQLLLKNMSTFWTRVAVNLFKVVKYCLKLFKIVWICLELFEFV